jgi:DNA replication and repair protein RecF
VRLRGTNGTAPFESEIGLGPRDARRARFNGAALRSAEQLRLELRTLVFTPDRLAVVKGAPATRRAYLDRALARLFPARASVPIEYAAAVGQRNAALRRLAAGASSLEALTPWTETIAALGAVLVDARRETLALLGPAFAATAAQLGLEDAALEYDGESPTVAEHDERLSKDLERGLTGIGPHLHDIRVTAGERELRSYGSQGEQRTAVLALVLAEAALLADERGADPLLLLDDVLSELDEGRREALLAALPRGGQTVVTATSERALPRRADAPALHVRVTPGAAAAA